MNLEIYAGPVGGFVIRIAGDTPQGFRALEKHLSLAELHNFVEALYRAEGAFYDGAGYEYSTR